MVWWALQPHARDPLLRDWASQELLSGVSVIIDFASSSLSFNFMLKLIETILLCFLNAISRVGRFSSACFRSHEPG